MSDEKVAPAPEVSTEHPVATTPKEHVPAGAIVDRPTGWRYKPLFGRPNLFYASPKVQLFMVAMVCFMCPGMYNALGGLGGAGLSDTTVQNNASTALYSTFAVVGFFSGTIANRIGLRLTLAFGGIGYCIYAASILSFTKNGNKGFPIFSGALLGVCAGLLWTGQGAIMMSYPPERSKGRYISWFWVIFNLGAVIGALIPLGANASNTSGDATDATFAGFIVLMAIGAILALFMVDADRVIREDGSKVILMKNPSWSSEFIGLKDTFMAQPWIAALFPMFFVSNIFYTYQSNDMNAAHFNTRARSLNNVLYWLSQIFGAVIFGYALDFKKFSRSTRAKGSFIALSVLTLVIWGAGWAWQSKQVTREVAEHKDAEGKPTYKTVDWNAGGELFIGPMFLMFFYGLYDAAWQTCIYWYMGALSNSSRTAANYAGFYKGIQSAGAAIFWALDGNKTGFNTMFGATWGLLCGSLLIASPIIFMKIQDTTPIEQDLKLSDETLEEVAATNQVVKVNSKDATSV